MNYYRKEIVVIGTSFGGPVTLKKILPKFRPALQVSILVIQHLPRHFMRLYLQELQAMCRMPVNIGHNLQRVRPGQIIFGASGQHTEIIKLKHSRLRLVPCENMNYAFCPSIDHLFSSVAKIYKDRVIGLLMTGLSHDGVEGLKIIKEYGGVTMVQDPATCIIDEMPRLAIKAGVVDYIVPLDKINERISVLLNPLNGFSERLKQQTENNRK